MFQAATLLVTGSSGGSNTNTGTNPNPVVQSTTTLTFVGPSLRAALSLPVTLSVIVSPAYLLTASPTGNVTFYDGKQVCGVAPVVNGTATLVTSNLTQGNHIIYAVYEGDGNYGRSMTGTITQMVFTTRPPARTVRVSPTPARPKKPAPKPKPAPHPVVRPRPHPVAKPYVAVRSGLHRIEVASGNRK